MLSRLSFCEAASTARVRKQGPALLRRVAHFVFVWSGLLFIHESGHAWIAARQGHEVRNIQVGVGPVLWRGDVAGNSVAFRLVPFVGVTNVAFAEGTSFASEGAVFAAGIASTAVFAFLVAAFVGGWERGVGNRCVWGRMIVADAIILTVFNLLPVPPLDGGRTALAAITAWRGAPLSDGALFWTQLSGLALAILPMTLWTRWTARIDSVAMWWQAPRRTQANLN